VILAFCCYAGVWCSVEAQLKRPKAKLAAYHFNQTMIDDQIIVDGVMFHAKSFWT
jgi:hypothetical protein